MHRAVLGSRALASVPWILALSCAMEASPAGPDAGQRGIGELKAALDSPVELVVGASGDTGIRQGTPNQNFGGDLVLRLQASGRNRGIVLVDTTAITQAVGAGTLVSAALALDIDGAGNNWGSGGAPIGAHRLTQATGEYAATWACSVDSNVYNSATDCAGETAWTMWSASTPSLHPWVEPATSQVTIANSQTGTVSLDVTSDVAGYLAGTLANHGWLLKKQDESVSGQVDFKSRERGAEVGPRLLLTVLPGAPPSAGSGGGGGGTQTTTALIASADSHVRQGSPNQNYGGDTVMHVKASGRNRALVAFDESEITATLTGHGLYGATLELTIVQTHSNWGPDRALGAHALKQVWPETGVTWNCAWDHDVTNSDDDCNGADAWTMWGASATGVPWLDPPKATAVVSSDQTGTLSFDVTRDVGCYLAGYRSLLGSWIVKKELENESGWIELATRETATPPRLLLAVGSGAGVQVTAEDCGGVDDDCDGTLDPPNCLLPPDPQAVAPAIDASAGTTFHDLFSFLTQGEAPIQAGVSPGVLDPRRVGAVHGRVRTGDGAGAPLVLISVPGHPEYGTTRSRLDGAFDLLLPGGGELLLRLELPGYVPVERLAAAPWRGSLFLDDVILTPRSTAVTVIDTTGSATGYQLARGLTQLDRDGQRQVTLLLPPGVQAQLVGASGSLSSLPELNLRLTELSAGGHGSLAMPGPLPGPTAYMLAVELIADEEIPAGVAPAGQRLLLSEPGRLYVEDFLGLPVGTVVPAGSYDRLAGAWVPGDSGAVIKLLAITSGVAELDVTGDGVADAGAALAALEITAEELESLATLYTSGQTLWRVLVPHLAAWDLSLAPGSMASAIAPPRSNPPSTPSPRQVVEVDVPVTGTSFALHYGSDRVLGYGLGRRLHLELGAPASLPVRPHHVRLSIMPSTGGAQSFRFVVPGAAVPYSDFDASPLPEARVLSWDWSGLDLAGRVLQGAYGALVTTSYEYACGYRAAAAFGTYATGPGVSIDPASGPNGLASAGAFGVDRGTCLLPQQQSFTLEQWDGRALGLGGFSLSAHHVALPDGAVLLGSGGRSEGRRLPVSKTLADPLAQQQPPFNAVPLRDAAIWTTGAMTAASDGSLYVAGIGPYLHRVAPNGLVTTIANADFDDLAVLPNGDVVATAGAHVVRIDRTTHAITQLDTGDAEAPSAIATDSAGRVFFSDCGSQPRVRMIDVDGSLSTVAGSGGWGSPLLRAKVDARSVPLSCVPAGALAVDSRGNVFFATQGGNRSVLQVDTAGQIIMLGGYDACWSASCYGHPSGLELDRQGNIYVAQRGEASVFRYTPGDTRAWSYTTHNETHEWVYGKPGELTDPRCNRAAGTPPSAFFKGTRGDNIEGIAISPDGSLYVAESCNVFTSAGQESLPGHVGYLRARRLDPAAENFVASADGAQYHVFDGDGRHLETRDATTNGVVYQFVYDSSGRLSQIIDGAGGATTIERDASGAPSAIVAPFGQVTALGADANGYLREITPDPSSPAYTLRYVDALGLLAALTTPSDATSTYAYDGLGLLASSTDPLGVTRTYSRIEGGSARTTLLAGPFGTLSVAQQRGDDGREVRTATRADGTRSVLQVHNAQQQTRTLPGGTVIEQTRGEDPRWGATGSISSTSTALPSGLTRQYSKTRIARLAVAGDPTSGSIVREQTTVNGASWETTIDLAAGTRTTVSPEGRVRSVTMDEVGRPVLIEDAGRSAVTMSYDPHGRLSSVESVAEQQTRSTQYNYSSTSGYLESIEEGNGDTHGYARDALERVTQWTRPDGQVVAINYDPGGNVIAITPPGKPAHAMAYTAVSALSQYSPPMLGSTPMSTVYEYTAAGKLGRVLLPDGREVVNAYRADGKLQAVTTPLGTTSYVYNPETGGLRSISDASGGTLTFGSDGQLPNITVWGGPVDHVHGWFERSYDASFRVASLGVNGASVVRYTRDADGLLTGAGAMQIARDAASGDVVGTTLDALQTVEQTSGHGELSAHYATYQGATLYSEEMLERDALGRITERREIVAGTTTLHEYQYDQAGRLSVATVDGTDITEYSYDDNGNRTARTTQSGTEGCTYDDQDRITSCGGTNYAHNAVGQLTAKTVVSTGATTLYDYDTSGNLRGVTLPDSRHIEYEIDAKNRRIGKKINGVRQWGLLYQTQLAPIAQLDAQGQVSSVFIYATKQHVPNYMLKGGQTYRFVTDHLGSVRMVVKTSDGSVAQRLDYDEFGNVLADSNPGFQPFGFAGGIYDPDTGLVRFGARDYDAVTGRWTAKDPVLFGGGQANLYVYVNGDPVNRTDPSGLYGTSSCSYYQQACDANGGGYECNVAPLLCPNFPTDDDPSGNGDPAGAWSDCVRQCLQERHRGRMPEPNACSENNNIGFGGDNAADHASCFAGCFQNPENPYDPNSSLPNETPGLW